MNVLAVLKQTGLLNVRETAAKPGQDLSRRSPSQREGGYTLLELLVVVILIGVLAAIAGPGWLSFVSQRRVNAANEFVLRSLQDAQSQAKSKKLTYSVSLIAPTGKVPAIAVHPGSTPPDPNDKRWKTFGQELGIKPGEIWLGTNASNNEPGTTLKAVSSKEVTAITFDYLGALQSTNNDLKLGNGLIIAVAAAQRNNPTTPLPQTNRCVGVTTILGAMQTGKLQDLTASNPKCQPR
jgi:prepilin-type N-terminal cleavage/methylation domain-containing protein